MSIVAQAPAANLTEIGEEIKLAILTHESFCVLTFVTRDAWPDRDHCAV